MVVTQASRTHQARVMGVQFASTRRSVPTVAGRRMAFAKGVWRTSPASSPW